MDGLSDAQRVAVLERQLASLQQLLEQRTALASLAANSGHGTGGKDGKGGGKPLPPHQRGGKASLAELIAAAGPTAAEVQQTAYLTTRLEQLEGQVAQAESANQRRLRALRQQHERVASGYEARIALLTERLGRYEQDDPKANKGGLAASRMRVRELEKQVEEVRATYGRKIKELEGKLEQAARDNAKGSKGAK